MTYDYIDFIIAGATLCKDGVFNIKVEDPSGKKRYVIKANDEETILSSRVFLNKNRYYYYNPEKTITINTCELLKYDIYVKQGNKFEKFRFDNDTRRN